MDGGICRHQKQGAQGKDGLIDAQRGGRRFRYGKVRYCKSRTPTSIHRMDNQRPMMINNRKQIQAINKEDKSQSI